MTSQTGPPVVRPRRHVKPPAYLADFQVQRPGSERRSQQSACSSDDEAKAVDPPLSSECESGVSTPISQRPPLSDLVLLDEWQDIRGDLQREKEGLHPQARQSAWEDLQKENDDLRSCIQQLPEILSALQGLKAENAFMKREIQQLATTVANPHKLMSPIPPPQFHEPETCHSQPVPITKSRDFHENPSAQIRQLTDQVRDCDISSIPDNQPEAMPRYRTPAQRVNTPPHAQAYPYAEPIQADKKVLRDPYYSSLDVKESYPARRSEDIPKSAAPCFQERTYRGPKPSIPSFTTPDPREFSRLRMALENLLPADATERFKYQILTDHLQLEEALLVADSYCNSTHPYTDTMQALIKMYGQPHKLVLQNIAEVMDGSNIRTGDVKAFKLFALRVRSLVSMLEQLGAEGTVELDCGSHVSRLQSKLPHELRTSFKRYIHPLRVAIPTLLDFSNWLEYELQVQDDGSRITGLPPEPIIKKRQDRRDPRASRKPTSILLGTEKSMTGGEFQLPTPDVKIKSARFKGRLHAYCPYCDNNNHFLNGCDNFKELTKEQKESWIRKNNRCWCCGRSHHASKCNLKSPCKTCHRKHLLILHDVNERIVANESEMDTKENSCLVNTTKDVLYVDRPVYSRKVLLKVSKVIITNGDKSIEAYAVLDDGSERTILLHTAAQQLNLKGQPEDLILRTVRQDQQVLHGAAVSFTVSPVTNRHKKFHIQGAFTAERLGLAEQTHNVTSLQKKYKHLVGLPLQQIDRVQPVLLIGSDCPHLVTPIEPVHLGPPGGPAAVRTRLGWTLQGPTHEIRQRLNTHQCLFTAISPNADLFAQVEKLWQMDVIPYRSEKVVTRSKLDQEAIRLLQEKTVRVNVDGVMRYATPLLRIQHMPTLHMPKEAVVPQLRSIERKLMKNPDQACAYKTEIERLKNASYVEKLQPCEAERSHESWYIPHHMVTHNGKNRVVYNCSFQYEGQNLNKLLLPGPTLSPSLLAVLLRFREHSTALSSDIRGMFHQVRLLPDDKPLLRFLWRDMTLEQAPDVYQWQVLPFGTTCSPCCATFALQKHVLDHTQPGEEVREVIEKSFYVDNCLHSLPSKDAAKDLVDRLYALLNEGGFELRQWASNCPAVVSHLPSDTRSNSCELWLSQGLQDTHESTLGLLWHCQSDTLHYKHRIVNSTKVTMRSIYRVLASQYDPLGYIIPYTTRAKMLVQRLWDKKRDWDDPELPEDLLRLWSSWEKELRDLKKISLPRCYSSPDLDLPTSRRDIHIFCDASEQAYGSVAYLRTENAEGQVEVAFLAARSRVAPRKQQSIPRLELCAALSGAQLSNVLITELTIPIGSVTLWSDSMTVLTWLLSSSCRYKVFVGTRVAEIQELTASATWRYIRSEDNPADSITRGKRLCDLVKGSQWNQGPSFLKLPPANWPKLPFSPVEEQSSELRQSVFCGSTTVVPLPNPQQYDTLAEFIKACSQQLHGAASITCADKLREVEQTVLRQMQTESFPTEMVQLKSGKPVSGTSRLASLSPEFDPTSGLIRVGGRLRRCSEAELDSVHPIVLAPQHPVTKLIIKDYDKKLHHPGPERVFAELRRTYWVLRGREAVRRHQHQCGECRKWKGQPEVPRMADLPLVRQQLFKPAFFSTGMDCFGPYIIKIGRRNEKRWGILFKCLTTRAVHIDLLMSIDSDSFLMALRRFIARRGKPNELLSDQGTNFKGGERELNESFAALHEELQVHLASQQIKFVFNPPGAPHFGGCWEREIRSIKAALKVTLGAQTVTEEVLRTVLTEIEGILNSKPLGYTSSDISDIDPITPNCFIIGRRDASLPQVVYQDSGVLSRRRWRHSQLLADHFWRHFIKYYLPSLQVRQKWKSEKRNLQIGDIVMIVDSQLPRALWPVGKITEVHPGADDRVRSATVQVEKRMYTRPVARLVKLPALSDEE
ncbi:uncharacterized protein LOC113094113 [Carassius auratus]|uniref:ribonuclease H n=1 Tax=Carassius auratus TaxID=7957 RepID=A0A6P6P3L0_CARAU|nr:uncharacterized protein LOC113094113 [Carassius auratus]